MGRVSYISMCPEEKAEFKVYKLTSPSGKIYIGFTGTTLARRISAHVRDSRNPETRTPLHYAIRKYGIEAFKISVLEWFDEKDKALAFEIRSIAKYKSVGRTGYNVTKGGNTFPEGYNGTYWMQGKTKKQLAAINAKKVLYGEDNGFFGCKHTEESMSRMVSTRKANGTYDGRSSAIAIRYQGIKYKNKLGMRTALNMGRIEQDRLIAEGKAKQLNVSKISSCSNKNKPVKYKRKLYASIKELCESLSVCRKVIRRLISEGSVTLCQQ